MDNIEDKIVRAKTVKVENLEEGMRCAVDVRNAAGAIMLPANCEIEQKHIDFLTAAGVEKLDVIVPKMIRPVEETIVEEIDRSRGILAATRTLVTDDSSLMRLKLTKILREMGISEISEAVNGRECLDILREGNIDLVTMDVEMPVMDGIEAVKIISREFPRVKTLMASSVGDEKRIVESITAGAMDFILKPLNHARVKKAVINVVSMFHIDVAAVDKIEEGARCACDVTTANGDVILPANTTIEMKHIPLLQSVGIQELELIIPRDIKSIESRVEDKLRFMRGVFADKRALIVDDSKLMRHKLWKIFKDMGIGAITQAENGRDGVEAALRTTPDIITMDIEMPELDGISAMRNITEKMPGARVIMISSLGEEEKIVQCMAGGARDFILKPLNDTRVKSAILNAL